jgi:hypothetical protein
MNFKLFNSIKYFLNYEKISDINNHNFIKLGNNIFFNKMCIRFLLLSFFDRLLATW